MVVGMNKFQEYFRDYSDQYILIGGAACDILFEANDNTFRATRDLDMVLVIEALTADFATVFWRFIEAGKYRNKVTSIGKPQFYRFDKPEDPEFPKMIELFARTEVVLKEDKGLTPVHIDDDVSSLSAILLNDDYYKLLKEGKEVVNGISVLRLEYLILFKARAYLDLSIRKKNGEHVDTKNIRKHKNDILKIIGELLLVEIELGEDSIKADILAFIDEIIAEPYEENVLVNYGLHNKEIIERLRELYKLQ